jgi:hypothetical protein
MTGVEAKIKLIYKTAIIDLQFLSTKNEGYCVTSEQ